MQSAADEPPFRQVGIQSGKAEGQRSQMIVQAVMTLQQPA